MKTNFESIILKNGFCVKKLQNKFLHSINIGVYIRKLPEPVCGIAHLVEHLFFRRLADMKQDKLYHETDRIGASFKAATYSDFISFDITVSPSKFKEALSLIAKLFCHFEWSADEISAEKEVVKRQIEARYESVYTKADLAYYNGTPKGFPLMGKTSHIDCMSTREINTYKSTMFVPENSCIVITGNFNNDNFNECIKLLDAIPFNNNACSVSDYCINSFASRQSSSDVIYSSPDNFSDVCISFDVDGQNHNRYAAELLFSILGFGVTSKLSQKLREQKGLIHEINGGIEFSNHFGRMTFEYEVNSEYLIESLLDTFKIFMQSKNNLTEADLLQTILFYTENQYRLLDDVRELNFLIGWRGFIESEQITSIDDLVARYNNVTIQDIRQIANNVLVPNNLIISVSHRPQHLSKIQLLETLKKCRQTLEVQQ